MTSGSSRAASSKKSGFERRCQYLDPKRNASSDAARIFDPKRNASSDAASIFDPKRNASSDAASIFGDTSETWNLSQSPKTRHLILETLIHIGVCAEHPISNGEHPGTGVDPVRRGAGAQPLR
eukprot:5305104-Prymnesium_polylepis.1